MGQVMEEAKSEIPQKTFSKFYSPSEHLAVDQVFVLFKGRVFPDNTYSRNTNVLASKLTKPYDETGYWMRQFILFSTGVRRFHTEIPE